MTLTAVDLLWLVFVFVIFEFAKVFCRELSKKMTKKNNNGIYLHYISKGEYEKLTPNQWRELHGFEPIGKDDKYE